ncbi:hypothetical protein ES703_108669 [subsurface metagenome]
MAVLFASLVIAYLFINLQDITAGRWVEISLLVGLVGITAVYAFCTAMQANASVKIAEEMTRPYLMLRLNLEENEFLQWDDYRGSKCADSIPITILNAGKGPAKNIEVSLWEPNEVHPYNRKAFLVLDEKWQTEVSRSSAQIKDEEWFPELKEIVKGDYPGIIVVKYKDIHQRSWISYLCLERWEIEEFVMEGEQNIVEEKK